MYWLLGIDTVLRITAALVLLFVVVPALAWGRPKSLGALEWFWWCAGVGTIALTLLGQLFTLLNVAGPLTYALTLLAIVILARSRKRGVSPFALIADAYRRVVVFVLNIVERRINLRRRFRRRVRQTLLSVVPRDGQTRMSVLHALAWVAIILVASLVRLFRPFVTANLGFSDTFVHLYLMRLLDRGIQIDAAWGPYPRGMHFLLLPIDRLTNVDPVLLMNFFGAFSGVLMTLAVAYAAKRITESTAAALVAGLFFATMVGGASQYFLLGGSVSGFDARLAREALQRPYTELMPVAGEFDVLLTTFQRQTSTLPQELAIAFLFPAALFLIDWFRSRSRWHLTGFIGCTAAIAAIHSGVAVPLVLLCAAAAIAVLIAGEAGLALIARGSLAGALGIALGSTWMIGFLFHTRVVGLDTSAGSATLYYFPFLRAFTGDDPPIETAYMMLTPFLIVMLVVATALAVWRRHSSLRVWLAISVILFTLTHAASVIGIPELVEVRRNASWLAMSIAALIGVAATEIHRRWAPAVALLMWFFVIPSPASMRAKLIDYSGYGATTLAVVRMTNELEPFTWTLVSYGQEYPMVLGKGFHVNAADFLEQFDPAGPLRIPTPLVFIAVEKNPHRFQINNWSTRFDRGAVEERLNTWCTVYRFTHGDMRVWLEDENVRIYAIERPSARVASAGGAS